jgi:hypothetical protein
VCVCRQKVPFSAPWEYIKRRRRSAFFKQIFLSLLGNGNAKWPYSFAAPPAALPRECCMRRLLSLTRSCSMNIAHTAVSTTTMGLRRRVINPVCEIQSERGAINKSVMYLVRGVDFIFIAVNNYESSAPTYTIYRGP